MTHTFRFCNTNKESVQHYRFARAELPRTDSEFTDASSFLCPAVDVLREKPWSLVVRRRISLRLCSWWRCDCCSCSDAMSGNRALAQPPWTACVAPCGSWPSMLHRLPGYLPRRGRDPTMLRPVSPHKSARLALVARRADLWAMAQRSGQTTASIRTNAAPEAATGARD